MSHYDSDYDNDKAIQFNYNLELRKNLKHNIYMNIACEIANLGTCKRLKVGAVLLRKDGSVASMGYNGAPSGMDHCTDETCNSENRCIHTFMPKKMHSDFRPEKLILHTSRTSHV